MTTYVVGDIQACYEGLRKLLDTVQFDPDKDTLWSIGDTIGRGPQALETLSFLHSLGDSFNMVLGNHDLHFLAVANDIRPPNKKDGYSLVLEHEMLDTFVQWMRQKPLAARVNHSFFLSHAGLYPLWSEEKALALAKEASEALTQENWRETMTYMYGSDDWAWQDSLSGLARIKFIIDAFTRMRFVNAEGTLNFSAKTGIDDAPRGYQAWFQHAHLKHESTLVFGHWAALQGLTHNPKIQALDTGYIWGGQLTCLALETNQKTSVPAN